MTTTRTSWDREATLVAQAVAGSEAAFEMLVLPLADVAYRLALTMLRDHAEAEDAVQEATLKAWRRPAAARLAPVPGGASLIHLGPDGTHLDQVAGGCRPLDEVADGTVLSHAGAPFPVATRSGGRRASWSGSSPPRTCSRHFRTCPRTPDTLSPRTG